jgi:hypothetical protein
MMTTMTTQAKPALKTEQVRRRQQMQQGMLLVARALGRRASDGISRQKEEREQRQR